MYKISPRLIIICPDSHSHIWASGLNAGMKAQRERERPSWVHLNLNPSLFIDFCSVNKSQRLRWVDGTLYVVLCLFISLVVLLGGLMIPTVCVGFYSVIYTPPIWNILIISNCALIGRTPELWFLSLLTPADWSWLSLCVDHVYFSGMLFLNDANTAGMIQCRQSTSDVCLSLVDLWDCKQRFLLFHYCWWLFKLLAHHMLNATTVPHQDTLM